MEVGLHKSQSIWEFLRIRNIFFCPKMHLEFKIILLGHHQKAAGFWPDLLNDHGVIPFKTFKIWFEILQLSMYFFIWATTVMKSIIDYYKYEIQLCKLDIWHVGISGGNIHTANINLDKISQRKTKREIHMKYKLFCKIFFCKSFLSSVWEHLEEFGLATVAKWLKLSPGRCRLT